MFLCIPPEQDDEEDYRNIQLRQTYPKQRYSYFHLIPPTDNETRREEMDFRIGLLDFQPTIDNSRVDYEISVEDLSCNPPSEDDPNIEFRQTYLRQGWNCLTFWYAWNILYSTWQIDKYSYIIGTVW